MRRRGCDGRRVPRHGYRGEEPAGVPVAAVPAAAHTAREGSGVAASLPQLRLAQLVGLWQRQKAVAKPRPVDGRPLKVDPDARAVYETLRSSSRTWAAREQELERLAPQAALLLEDLFYAFFTPRVELNPDTSPAFHWNFAILAALLPSDAYRRLRAKTVGDPVTAALASLHMVEQLCTPERLPSAVRRALWSAWQATDLAALRLPLRARPDAERLEHPGQYVVLRALDGAAQALAMDERLRSTWGLQPGVRSAHAFDDVHGLLAAVRALPGFVELTDALERFARLLRPAPARGRQRPGHGYKRLVGLTWGGDLDRVVPEEAAKLHDTDLEDLFREAYEHRRMWQERYEGDPRRAAGPIVCCMDTSRSMNAAAALGLQRFLWAKGVGLALLDVARRGNRTFLGLCFAGEQDLAAFEFTPGSWRPQDALEMARCDFDGGTHFQAPLREALGFLQRHRRPGEPGHLVFITDGDAPLPASFAMEFRAAKAAAGFQMISVFIDGFHPDLRALSDYTFTVRADRMDSWERAVADMARRLT